MIRKLRRRMILLVLCGLWGVLRHRGNLLRLLPAAQLQQQLALAR